VPRWGRRKRPSNAWSDVCWRSGKVLKTHTVIPPSRWMEGGKGEGPQKQGKQHGAQREKKGQPWHHEGKRDQFCRGVPGKTNYPYFKLKGGKQKKLRGRSGNVRGQVAKKRVGVIAHGKGGAEQ